MKRFALLLGVLITAGVFTGTRMINAAAVSPKANPRQCGYTIIEAGKALNCHGDTINIQKVHPEIIALNKR